MPKKAANIGSRLGNRVSIKKLVNKKTGEPTHKFYVWRATYMVGDERKQKGFKTKAAAERFKSEREAETMVFGSDAMLTIPERNVVRESREQLVDAGISLREAVEYALDHHRKASESVPVSQVIEELLAAKVRSKKSASYIQTLKSRLNRFNKTFSERHIATITGKEVTEWIDGLDVGDRSKNHYRREVGTLFGFAVKAKHAEENVVTDIDTIKLTPSGEIGILTPREASRLVAAADDRILPVIAIGLFAGVRDAELKRLDWDAVKFSKSAKFPYGHIYIKAAIAKTASRRYIPITENLHAILKPLANKSGAVYPPSGRSEFEFARLKAGFGTPKQMVKGLVKGLVKRNKLWKHNALRHSYASYHLAHNNSLDDLVSFMGHSDTSLIFKHYREAVMPEDAAAYWSIGLVDDSKIVNIDKSA